MTVKEYNYSVSNYADNVYRFVLKNLRNEEKAKDIVQDAFEKVWHKREKVDGAKAKSYLFTTAYRCMIDSIRREKKESGKEFFLCHQFTIIIKNLVYTKVRLL